MNTRSNTSANKLPVGIQDFEYLRNEGYLYIDKTAYIYRLATTGKPYFLSRPRRFGKSLLLSTMKAYFEGKKELFHGLAIEQLEQDWRVHPVLHLSLNSENYDDLEALRDMLDRQLIAWEELYETKGVGITHSGRFMEVIRKACEKTGRRVVVLVDEYDKPLLRTFHNETLQNQFRNLLTAFYTVLKDADQWLQFVFITGVTKFAQVGVFSTMNQLSDISLTSQYAGICGLTRAEMETTLAPELEAMAEKNELSYEEMFEQMTRMYDGYQFSQTKIEGMYNPFSVLSALSYQNFESYWFTTGTPTFLVEILKRTNFDLRKIDGIEVSSASLIDSRVDINNPIPLLYQSGYLTIKDYEKEFKLYKLGYPNEEVKYGFLNFTSAFYTPISADTAPFYIGKFVSELRAGDSEAFMTRMQAFFAGIPYELSDNTERHYQVVFYLVFSLMGQYAEAEVRSSHGRADAVVKTANHIYVFEFKLSGTAEEALLQIDEKGYLIPYATDHRTVVKIGASFSKEKRNIDRWLTQVAGGNVESRGAASKVTS